MTARDRGRRRRQALARALRDERGYTLIELLVATFAGVIVTAAMGAIVIVSVHFSKSFNDRTDVNQEGRIAMQKVVQALDSGCVASGVAPIISTGSTGSYVSDGTHMYFYSGINTAPAVGATVNATPNPNLEEVLLTGTTGNTSLVMNTYPYVSGSVPSAVNTPGWTFGSTATPALTLLPHAALTGTTAVFQYFGYGAGGALNTTPFSVPLSTTNAGNTAAVLVSFEALPSDGFTTAHVAADIQSQAILRLTPASAATGVTNAPCS
jgi:hypothetical protein